MEVKKSKSTLAPASWIYLILLFTYTVVLIFIVAHASWEINLVLLVFQLIALNLAGLPFKKIVKIIRRLLTFLSMIFVVSAFFTDGKIMLWGFKIYDWPVNLTLEGLLSGAKSVLDFLTLISISGFYQLAFFERSLMDLSRKLPLFTPVVLIQKYLSRDDPGKNNLPGEKGKNKRTSALRLKAKLNESLEKFGVFAKEQNLLLSEKTVNICGVSLLLFTMKMLKVLPGIPFASGQRLIFTLPLLFFASKKAGSFGATWTAWTYGFLALIFGQQGNLGILELFRLVLLGFTVDVLQMFLPRREDWKLLLALTVSGALAGLSFAFFGIFWATLFNVPDIIYLFATPRFIFNAVFGAISGPLCYYLLSSAKEIVKITDFKKNHGKAV